MLVVVVVGDRHDDGRLPATSVNRLSGSVPPMPGAISSDSGPNRRAAARPAAATIWRANGLAIDVRAAGDAVDAAGHLGDARIFEPRRHIRIGRHHVKSLPLDVTNDEVAHVRGVVAFDQPDAERGRRRRRNDVARQRAGVAARDATDGQRRQQQPLGQ